MSIEDKTKTDKDAGWAEERKFEHNPNERCINTYDNPTFLLKMSSVYMQYIPAMYDIAGILI